MTEKVLGDLWADWLPVGSLVAMAACITHLRFFIYLIRSARWAVLSPLLLIAHHNGLLDASLLDPCPALIGVHHLEHYNDVWDTNALCGYPLVKMELEIQTRFLPRLPFSCNSIISDKIWRKMSLSLSIFLVLPQISLVKYYETIKILMQIFWYFRSHFHNVAGPGEKSYFEVFFSA